MGFGEKWIGCIRSIFNSMKASVLVNGSPTEEFEMQRGLRQGDPLSPLLSPLLFNLAGEFFSVLMRRAESLGLIKGIRW